ncbi:MAG: hypothetical protein LBR38_00380 [Synergistaceae bacterium]|jgi:hypothetical protein|nr:hypothetical protein [Synergistaceae bacterium]
MNSELDRLAERAGLGQLAQLVDWPSVIAVTGALGSGKTEFVLNLALGLKLSGKKVTIADADIINPYFCIRQVTEALERDGFTVLTPPEAAKWSDMSVINAGIGNAIAAGDGHLIIDVGGDAGGVMALKQFEPLIDRAGYLLVMVVNAYRPKTSTPEGTVAMAKRMETLCGLKVGALVCNSHLMEDTKPEDAEKGLEVVLEAGRTMGLPVLYSMVRPEHAAGSSPSPVPLWPMTRFMKRPWEGSEMWA